MAEVRKLFLCKTVDLAPGEALRVERGDGSAIAVFNIDGVFYAIDDACTHGGVSLAEGELEGEIVECFYHFGGFHVPTGKSVLPPCSVDVRTYRVEVEGVDLLAVLR